jgi:hypothetical protein
VGRERERERETDPREPNVLEVENQ